MKAEVNKREEKWMKKILLAFSVAVMLVAVGSVSATLPEFNENQDINTTVNNSRPRFIYGWVVILDQLNVFRWTNFDEAALMAAVADMEDTLDMDLELDDLIGCITYPDNVRCDPYCFESESLWVYAIIVDLNGASDLWQHTMKAWLSPTGIFLKDMALTEDFPCGPFVNPTDTVGIFKGEKFVEAPEVWQCLHDVYIEDLDKYDQTSIPEEFVVLDQIWINPWMGSTFTPSSVEFDAVISCGPEVEATSNPHIEHVYAFCDDLEVTVDYKLKIHGTDMEGAIHTSHVIPCENVRYVMTRPDGSTYEGWLSCDEVVLGDFQACQDIYFDFFLEPPCPIEPGDYHGEVGFAIEAI
jgi:hypothetical protein